MGWRSKEGQVGKVGYVYSAIYLSTKSVSPIPGPVLKGWGLPLITNSEHGLECQIEESGINKEGKGATESCGVGGAKEGWQGKKQKVRGASLVILFFFK